MGQSPTRCASGCDLPENILKTVRRCQVWGCIECCDGRVDQKAVGGQAQYVEVIECIADGKHFTPGRERRLYMIFLAGAGEVRASGDETISVCNQTVAEGNRLSQCSQQGRCQLLKTVGDDIDVLAVRFQPPQESLGPCKGLNRVDDLLHITQGDPMLAQQRDALTMSAS